MNKEEIKLSDKELHQAIDNLKGTQFLDAFCIIDWVIKTRNENKELQQKVNQLEKNRDEAIELNKKINNLVAFGDSENKLPDLVWELSSILERGKE